MDAAKTYHKLVRLPGFPRVGKAVCLAVASVHQPRRHVSQPGRSGIAMGDEIVEVVNLGQFEIRPYGAGVTR